jgi:hypothetical protein
VIFSTASFLLLEAEIGRPDAAPGRLVSAWREERFTMLVCPLLLDELGEGSPDRSQRPVENPGSSCISCHSTAQIPTDLSRPTVSGIVPANASAATLRKYFRNVKSQTPFTPGQISLDYSLQLQNGIANIAQSGTLKPAAHPTPDASNRKRRLHRANGIKVTRI